MHTRFCLFSLSDWQLALWPRASCLFSERPGQTLLTTRRQKDLLHGAESGLEGFYSYHCMILEKPLSFHQKAVDTAEQILILLGLGRICSRHSKRSIMLFGRISLKALIK